MVTPTPDPLAAVMTNLTGHYVTPDGKPISGKLTFTPPAILSLPDQEILSACPAEVELDINGQFSIFLLSTDNAGMSPQDWTYQVTETLDCGGRQLVRRYAIYLPAYPPVVDISTLAPASPNQGRYLPVAGPPGPAGVATGFAFAQTTRVFSREQDGTEPTDPESTVPEPPTAPLTGWVAQPDRPPASDTEITDSGVRAAVKGLWLCSLRLHVAASVDLIPACTLAVRVSAGTRSSTAEVAIRAVSGVGAEVWASLALLVPAAPNDVLQVTADLVGAVPAWKDRPTVQFLLDAVRMFDDAPAPLVVPQEGGQ